MSVNLERPVPNSTNCTAIESEISVQVTDKNTEPESKLNNNKQPKVCKQVKAKIEDIITRAETKNTKDSTKWAIRVFECKFHIIKVRNFKQLKHRYPHGDIFV